MIEGGVWGGGCEMAMACDVPYNVAGMLTLLNSASLRIIKEMVFIAKPVTAERALQAGLINHLVPLEDLETFTYSLATDSASWPPEPARLGARSGLAARRL